MKRILLATAIAAAMLTPMSAHADSYCVSTGIRIFGEPWLAHQICVDCPTGPCPWYGAGSSDSPLHLGADR
ncbi:MAG: hypothetical protein ACYDCC_14760 [Actinomycetota bacterium]